MAEKTTTKTATENKATDKPKKRRKSIKYRLDVFPPNSDGSGKPERSYTMDSLDDAKVVKIILIDAKVFTTEHRFFVVKLIDSPREAV